MKAFYADRFVLPLPASHVFPMAKYARVRETVIAEGLLPPEDLLEAPAASWEELALVHSTDYLDAVRTGTLSREIQRRIGFPWSIEMVERSRRSVGATVAAARTALEEGAGINLAGGTHHAFRDHGEGYCVFNDVVVAARSLIVQGGAQRVAVIDCDVHQGNGTAAIFRGDPAVFTFSMHAANNFPFQKEESDLDVVLEDGTRDDEYLELLELHLPQVISHHKPDLVFYLAGADPFSGDRFGRLSLSIEGLAERDSTVFEYCARVSVPVVVTMSGGYAKELEDIVAIHTNTVRQAVRVFASAGSL